MQAVHRSDEARRNKQRPTSTCARAQHINFGTYARGAPTMATSARSTDTHAPATHARSRDATSQVAQSSTRAPSSDRARVEPSEPLTFVCRGASQNRDEHSRLANNAAPAHQRPRHTYARSTHAHRKPPSTRAPSSDRAQVELCARARARQPPPGQPTPMKNLSLRAALTHNAAPAQPAAPPKTHMHSQNQIDVRTYAQARTKRRAGAPRTCLYAQREKTALEKKNARFWTSGAARAQRSATANNGARQRLTYTHGPE